jgi:RNase H-fold protein (predicted Holliday junction resolvase)
VIFLPIFFCYCFSLFDFILYFIETMICDWRYEDQTDLSDNDLSAEISLADNGNDRGEFSELTRRRKSWANSSIASEDGESILWKRVDYQLELLSAMDESDREETRSPVHPIMTDAVSPKEDEKSDKDVPSQAQNKELKENYVKSYGEKQALSPQGIPSNIPDGSNGREDGYIISSRRSRCSADEQVRCPPSTATEILAVVGAQRERRKSLTIGRRASVDVNQLLRLMNETKNASSPADDNVNLTDNGNPLSLDKEHKKNSDSDEEANKILLPYGGESRSSSLYSKEGDETIHSSNAKEVFARAGAIRERRKSVADSVRASIIVHQLLGLPDGNNKVNPNNDGFQNLVEVEKDIDSEEEVNRFLESISPHPSLLPDNQNYTTTLGTAPAHKGRRVSFADTESKVFSDEALTSVPRSHGRSVKDSNIVYPKDMNCPTPQSQRDEVADEEPDASQIKPSTLEKKNSERRISRKKKIKRSISLSEQINDDELSCDQILTSVAAQRERRKHVVQKKHDRDKGRSSSLIERKEEVHLSHNEAITEDEEAKGEMKVEPLMQFFLR